MPEELVALRDSLRTFLAREVAPIEREHQRELQETGTIDPATQLAARRAIRRKAADAGFYGMGMPEDVGGMGVSTLGMSLCFEVLGESGLLLAERGGVLPSVEGPTRMMLAMNDKQRKEYLEPLMRGQREACFALTEPEAGSDATNIQTRAVRDGDCWVVNGRKHFITNGQYADFIQLFAATEAGLGANGGITFFLVDADRPGVSVSRIQQTLGEDRPAELTFEDVRVHQSKVVGEVGFGFRAAMSFINEGRLNIASMAVGKAQYLLDRMIFYARERQAFGNSIGKYQFVQQHVVDSYIEIGMARQFVYEAADAVDRGDRPRRAAAAAKIAATEMVARVSDRAIQVFGGNGVMTEIGVERFYRDVRAMRLYEGTSEVLRGTIAKTLGFPD